MNPILISPKIESDKSVLEQLNQMKSYLYQFKENVELILANIDDANVSKQYENKLYNAFSREIVNSAGMSEVLQAAGIIKLTVKNVEDSVASLSLEVGDITAEIDNPTTGILARLSVNENAISGEVTRAENAENALDGRIDIEAGKIAAKVSKVSPTEQTNFAWEMTDSKMEWTTNGNRIMLLNSSGLYVKGEIEATSGYIGSATGVEGFKIEPYQILHGTYNVIGFTYEEVNPWLEIGDLDTVTFLAGDEVEISSDKGMYDPDHPKIRLSAGGGIELKPQSQGVSVDGALTIDGTLTIPSGSTLSIPSGGTFSFEGHAVTWKRFDLCTSSDYVLVKN